MRFAPFVVLFCFPSVAWADLWDSPLDQARQEYSLLDPAGLLALDEDLVWTPSGLASEPLPPHNYRFSITIGQKTMSDNEWRPVDDQSTFGLEFEFLEGPVKAVIGVLGSADEKHDVVFNEDVTGSTREFYAGVRYVNTSDDFTYWAGGGLALIEAALEFHDPADGSLLGADNDTGFGPWIGAGVGYRLGSHFLLGVELGFSYASISLPLVDIPGDPAPTDAGGFKLGVVIAIPW